MPINSVSITRAKKAIDALFYGVMLLVSVPLVAAAAVLVCVIVLPVAVCYMLSYCVLIFAVEVLSRGITRRKK